MNFIFDDTDTGVTELDQHLQHVRNVDWASTSLGPLDLWPHDLLLLAHIMMLDPQPRLLLLGSLNWMLYNVAYAKSVAGDKHPEALGMTQVDAWSADVESSVIDEPNKLRKVGYLPKTIENYRVPLMRNGHLEECILSWTLIPLAGSLTGVYVSLTDVTQAHIAERRKGTVLQLEKAFGAVQDLKSLWEVMPKILTSNSYDFPFTLLFRPLVDVGPTCQGESIGCQKRPDYHLEASAGQFDITGSRTRLFESSPVLKRAMETKEWAFVGSDDPDFRDCWSEAFTTPDSRNAIVVCPLGPSNSDKIMKVLTIGLNARNPFNSAYQNWVSQLMQMIRDKITSLLLAEEENMKRLRVRMEALERARLSAKEASHVTEKWLRMQYIVDQVNVGIFELLPDGSLVHSNVSRGQTGTHRLR